MKFLWQALIKALWICDLHALLLMIIRIFSRKCFYFGIQLSFQMFCHSRETFSGNPSICVKITQNCDKNEWVCVCVWEWGREIDSSVNLGHLPGMEMWVLKSTDACLDLLSTRSSWHFNKKLKGSKLLKHQFFIQNVILGVFLNLLLWWDFHK